MKLQLQLLLMIFTVFSDLSAQKETLEFEIIYKEKVIGILSAQKEIQGERTTYTNHTSIDTRIITKIEIDYHYEVVFTNRNLFCATALIELNGKERTNTYTEKAAKGYIFYRDGNPEKKINQSIDYSTARLMFEEPGDTNKVYAEEHGEFHELRKTGQHTYVKTTPKGNTNTYTYKNGFLVKAEIDAGLISFEIVRKVKSSK